MDSMGKTYCETDEEYRCGEVFLRKNSKIMKFVCTQCDESFKHLEKFVLHLNEELEIANRHQEAGDENNCEDKELLEPMHTMYLPETFEGDINEEEISTYNGAATVPIKLEAEEAERSTGRRTKYKSIYKCSDCDKAFGAENYLHKHMLLSHGLASAEDTTINTHHATKLEDKPELQNGDILKEFAAKETPVKKKRRRNKHPKIFQCTDCKRIFAGEIYLKKHIQLVHETVQSFPCDLCGASFSNKPYLSAHKRRHTAEPRHTCDFCPRRFITVAECKTHMRVHTGDKPYVCEECGRTHKTSSQLLQHRIRTHLNKRDFECGTCQKRFTSNSELRRHIFVVHSNAPRDKKCDDCGAAFKTVKSLTAHRHIHKGKTYECLVCGKAFAQNAGLYSHMKIHSIVRQNLTEIK